MSDRTLMRVLIRLFVLMIVFSLLMAVLMLIARQWFQFATALAAAAVSVVGIWSAKGVLGEGDDGET